MTWDPHLPFYVALYVVFFAFCIIWGLALCDKWRNTEQIENADGVISTLFLSNQKMSSYQVKHGGKSVSDKSTVDWLYRKKCQ